MDIKKTILTRYPNADLEYLDRYIEICSLPAISGQRHHILPRKLWPNEINSDWNIIVITPYNHVIAHYYFSKATGALWNAIRFFSGKNNPAVTDEQVVKVAQIYSEFIKSYIRTEEHARNHLDSQQRQELRKLRSIIATNLWKDENTRTQILTTRKHNYTQDVRDKRCKSQAKAQSKLSTCRKRSASMTALWADPHRRKSYDSLAYTQQTADYWKMPLKQELYNLWITFGNPKKCAFSNMLKSHGIMIHPNKLRALVDEFNAHGFKSPVNTRG